jgi:hypothetical protein
MDPIEYHLRMETGLVFETLCSLESRKMDTNPIIYIVK